MKQTWYLVTVAQQSQLNLVRTILIGTPVVRWLIDTIKKTHVDYVVLWSEKLTDAEAREASEYFSEEGLKQ